MPNPSYVAVYVIAMLLFSLYASWELKLSVKSAVSFVIGMSAGVPLACLLLWILTASIFAM